MKIKSNRLLSFLLAFLMFFPVFGALLATAKPALASSEDLKGEVRGNQKVFTIDKEKIENIAINTQAKKTLRRSRRSLFSDRAPSTQAANTIVNLKTIGLNNGDFDWKVFNNSEFNVTLGYTDSSNKFVEVGKMTFSEGQNKITKYIDWPLYAANAKGFQLKTDFGDNYDVRARYVSPSTTPKNNVLELNLTVYELPNTNLKVQYQDIYGKALTENLPEAGDTAPKIKLNLGDGVEFDLPKADKEINLIDLDGFEDIYGEELADKLTDAVETDNLNAVEKLDFKINNAIQGDYTFVSGDNAKKYKYKIEHVNVGKTDEKHDFESVVTMTYQADVAIPPMKDDDQTQPVDVPDGYYRLTFNADEKQEAGKTPTKGRFDSEGTKKKYIDVKQGLKYGNEKLKAEIAKLKPKALDDKGNQNDAKPFLKWNPEIPADTEDVGTKEYNAKYKTTADLIKELGGLKGVDFGVWKDTSTAGDFWKKGVAANTTDNDKKAKIDEALASATVEDTTTPARTTAEAGEKKGTLKVTFKDGSVYVVDDTKNPVDTNIKQTLHVYDKGDTKPDPGTGGEEKPVPAGTIFVEFTRDETSIKKAEFENLKPLMYADGDTVDSEKFPKAKPETGYQTVTWTPAKDTALSKTNQAYKEETKTFTFKASATKKNAKQLIEDAGGLKPVDISIWSGDAIKWSKGVAINYDTSKTFTDEEKNALEDLLKKATVTDESNRSNTTVGKQPGTLKVKFADDTTEKSSVINVSNQNLFVRANKEEIKDDNKDYPVPKDDDGKDTGFNVIFKLGEGTKLGSKTGNKDNPVEVKKILVKKDDTLTDSDYPAVEPIENDYKKPITWSPANAAITKETIYTATATNAKFDKTNIAKIEITKDPDTMTYTEGDKPKHDGIKVKLTDKNGNTVEIGKDDLGTYGVTVTPAETTDLTIANHNNHPFTAKVNGKDNLGQTKELTAKTTKNITVNPKKSDKDVIPYIPSDKNDPTNPNDPKVPTTDGEGHTIVISDYDIVAFKTESTDKGTLSKGTETNQEVVSVLVKKTARDKSFGKVKKAVTVVEKTGYKFWYWGKGTEKTKVEDTATIVDKDVYTGYFIENGQEITPGTSLPDGTYEVKVLRDEVSIKADNLYGKSYAVFKDSKLDKAKFPTPEVLNNNFKDPKWYKDTETTATEQPWTVTITANTSFKASAISANFDKENITGIEITKDPDTMTYTEGDKPKHDGIKVKLTDKNGNSVEIGKDKLKEYGVTVTPAETTDLTIANHNNHPFTAKVNGKDNLGQTKELTAKTTKNITVNPKKSDKDVIPYIPSDKNDPTNPNDPKVPTTDGDGKIIDKNDYDIVAFKTESTDKGTLSKGKETDKDVISVMVKKNSNTTFKVAKPSVTEKTGYKLWYWDEKDAQNTKVKDTAVVSNGQVYTAHFIKNGQEIKPGDPELPKDGDGNPLVFKVEIIKGDNVKADDGYGKTHAVFKDSTLQAAGVTVVTPAALDDTATDQYEPAKWYKDAETTETANPWTVAITADTKFTAKAAKKAQPQPPVDNNTGDDVIPYLPTEDVPTKGSDGKDIPTNYIIVTFQAEKENGTAKGTVTVG
ncbi:hypothetical protein, partial [Anaerococcus lactolyticus]|uniref:hypothetical protein n=1 Tax=Anaerococcus lactolyticus TaxID=33032 RepID=UPI00288B0EF8